MIKSLVDDLKDLNIYLLLPSKFNKYFEDFNINIININEPLDIWLKKNSKNFNKAIFIADEGNNHLYNLTRILEENNLEIYCSNSKSVYNSSNKFITYNELKGKVKQPKTFKLKVDNDFEENVKSLFRNLNCNLIIKPLDGVDCENVSLLSSLDDINLINNYKYGSEVLIQEYIFGEPCSVSILTNGEDILPLSLNKQNIVLGKGNNYYEGGFLPYNHPLKDKAFEIAINAIKNIEGLKGFVGVDLILGEDDVTFIEINSRFTTPYIGIKNISNINIGKTIFKLLNNELNIKSFNKNFKLNGEVEFIKENNIIKLIKKG